MLVELATYCRLKPPRVTVFFLKRILPSSVCTLGEMSSASSASRSLSWSSLTSPSSEVVLLQAGEVGEMSSASLAAAVAG